MKTPTVLPEATVIKTVLLAPGKEKKKRFVETWKEEFRLKWKPSRLSVEAVVENVYKSKAVPTFFIDVRRRRYEVFFFFFFFWKQSPTSASLPGVRVWLLIHKLIVQFQSGAHLTVYALIRLVSSSVSWCRIRSFIPKLFSNQGLAMK